MLVFGRSPLIREEAVTLYLWQWEARAVAFTRRFERLRKKPTPTGYTRFSIAHEAKLKVNQKNNRN